MASNASPPISSEELARAGRLEPVARELRIPAPTERLVSLDSFRGFIMFWIIGGGGLMAGLQALGKNPVIDTVVYELNHTPWQGLRFYDCIWPSFMLMVGVSIPLSYARRSATETYNQMLLHALKRAAVLFLLGSVRESAFLGSPYLIELSSALQPIAIAYLVGFLLVRKSVRFQIAVGALILAGYGFLLALVPAPGIPAGTYQLNHNLVNAIDVALLRDHWLRWPYAPEGWGTVLSTIPTVSTTILGMILGESLMSARGDQAKLRSIVVAGLSCLILGYALSPFVPVIMKMWTTSYGLVSAGWACLMFALFYWVVDVRGYRKWCFPFVVIGSNAVFIYMFTSLLHLDRGMRIFTSGIARTLGRGGPPFHELSVVVVEWIILFWMFKRRIFIKA
jgi:predicted acyltransferase